MFGIYEVIALALALNGFGVQANPKPPSADVVLEYALDDADVIAYVDAVPLIPGNYAALKKLPDAPEIKNNEHLREIVGKVIAEVEGARGTMKMALGVDLTTDLSNATIFVKVSDPPEMLIVARGKFPADLPTKISKLMGGKVEKIGDGEAVLVGGKFEMVAVKGGVVFAGSRATITPRLAKDWKAPARAKGSVLAEAAKILGDKPVYMAAVSMASGRVGKAITAAGGDDAKFIERFELVAGAVFHNGIGWVIKDKDADGHARSVMASEGVIDLMRAAHLAPRGFAKLLLSFLDDIKTKEPGIEELKQHRGDILKLLDTFTGDGNFKVKTDNDAKGFRLAVRASGKKLSDVVPLGLILPGMYFAVAGRKPEPPPATTVVKPVTPRPSGGIKTPPKPAPKPAHP